MYKTDIAPLIGDKRTLILGCVESDFLLSRRFEGKVFIYSSPGGVFQNKDNELEEQIKYYLSWESCTQIIIVGHVPCHAVDYILHSEEQDPWLEEIRSHLIHLINNNHINLLNKSVHDKALLCELVISQARLLAELDFIQREIEENDFTIKGVVCDGKIIDTVFSNGLVVNTPILLT